MVAMVDPECLDDLVFPGVPLDREVDAADAGRVLDQVHDTFHSVLLGLFRHPASFRSFFHGGEKPRFQDIQRSRGNR